MALHALGYGPEDPVNLVESCYRAVEWLLATHTARGVLIPRPACGQAFSCSYAYRSGNAPLNLSMELLEQH